MSVKYDPLSTVPGYVYTRSGAKSELSSTGVPVAFAANAPGVVSGVGYWSRAAATNVLLNAGAAADLVAQTVNVTAVAHTLSFIGTGSVALSGAHAATLTGTGVNNRVVLVFTPTAGALVLTVTGSVTYAGLIAANIPDGGPIIATTTAAATVGADNLRVNENPPDVTQLFWATTNILAYTAGTKGIAAWSDGTNANSIALYINGTANLRAYATAANVTQERFSATVPTGLVTVLALRSGANWRFGMVAAGVLTWFAVEVAHAFPTGLIYLNPGSLVAGGSPLQGRLTGAFRKLLTDTSDANILSTVTGGN